MGVFEKKHRNPLTGRVFLKLSPELRRHGDQYKAQRIQLGVLHKERMGESGPTAVQQSRHMCRGLM